MANRQQLLAQLLAQQQNATTGASSARDMAFRTGRDSAAGRPLSQPTAVSVDRNRMRTEILQQHVDTPRTQPGTVPAVGATQTAAVANIVKAVLANRQRKKNDAQSRELLARELEMAKGGNPFSDGLEAIVPPSLRGIEVQEGPGADEARQAQAGGLRPFVEATEANIEAEKPARGQHDLAVLRSGGVEGTLAAQRLFPEPDPTEKLAPGEILTRGGQTIASNPKSADPVQRWETYQDAAGNTMQRNLATGEVKRVVEGEQPDPETDDVREYEYAKAGGYAGSFEEWQVLMGRSRAPRTENVPTGYSAVRDEQGNILRYEAIPGGPAAIAEDKAAREEQEATRKAEEAAAAAERLRSGEMKTAFNRSDDIDRALGIMDSGGLSGVGGMSFVKDIPIVGSATDAKDVEGLFSTIKAQIGFDELQNMRKSSPTGGALGNVTERELAFLQALQGSLDQTLDDDELRRNLNRLWNGYMDVIHGEGNGPPRRADDFEPGVQGPRSRQTTGTRVSSAAETELTERARSYYAE